MEPAAILEKLRSCPGVRLSDLPTSSGIYALRDHTGAIRYLGLAHSEGFRTRIRNKHSTGSEGRSHKFSSAYNSGRLWRDRHLDPKIDAAVAKKLRNEFIQKHCRASVVEIPNYSTKAELARIEQNVIDLAAQSEILWNGKFVAAEEPRELIDQLMIEMRFSSDHLAAVERQNQRYLDQLA